jgi:hypothetical protein
MPTELPPSEGQAPQAGTAEKSVQSPPSTNKRKKFWGFLKDHSTGISTWVDITNKTMQILALLVAGWWSWNLWSRTSAPGLESKLNVQTDVNWNPSSNKDDCQASLSIDLKNEGQRSVEVDEVTITAWMIDLQSFNAPSKLQPTFLDTEFIESHGTRVYGPASDGPAQKDLIGHYSPGVGHNSTVAALFKKSPGTIFYFETEVKGHASRGLIPFTAGDRIPVSAWTLEQVCGTQKPKTKVALVKDEPD